MPLPLKLLIMLRGVKTFRKEFFFYKRDIVGSHTYLAQGTASYSLKNIRNEVGCLP